MAVHVDYQGFTSAAGRTRTGKELSFQQILSLVGFLIYQGLDDGISLNSAYFAWFRPDSW